MGRLNLVLSGIIVSSLSLGCTNARLFQNKELSSLSADFTGDFCTLNMTSTSGIKFYFIMDVTGSNAVNATSGGVTVPATDPGKPGATHRSDAMISIAEKYPDAKFALQTFSSDENQTPIQHYFDFADSQDFINESINGTSGFNAIEDYGGTDYDAPLKFALQHIIDYLQAQSQLPREMRDPWGPMIVLFASDGIPNMGQYDKVTLQNDVKAIVDVINKSQYKNVASQIISQIIVNTAGYGGVFANGGTTASQYLQWMAEANNGMFVNLGTGAFDLDVLTPAPLKATGVFDKFFATNLNVVWEQNSTGTPELKWDSDFDGLSDDREALLKSNSSKMDSDDDMIGDGTANLIVPGKPCSVDGCLIPTSAQSNPQNPVWNRCKLIPDAEGGGTGYYTNDIMNNCEKMAFQVDYRLFSNAGDNVPDGVKIRAGYSPLDSRLSHTDPDNDNLTTLDKIISNLPSWLSQRQISAAGIPGTNYNIHFTGVKPDGRSCYTFNIQHMPVLAKGPNKVRLWLTQTDIYKRDTLRTVDVMLSPFGGASVSDDQFLPNQSQVPQ